MKIPIKKLLLVAFPLSICFSQVLSQVKGRPAIKKVVPQAKASAKLGQPQLSDPWKLLGTTEKVIEITTDFGVMIARLYDSTPKHRDNFVRLVQQKFYDSLLFHRVISDFMIQGGDPLSKNAPGGAQLGSGSAPGEKIPAELKANLFHKKGVLAAARDNNPDKASSNCQFYIVQGKTISEPELESIFNQRVKPSNPLFSYNKHQKEIYSRIGGTPFLDQNYTVFGEVISGLDVIGKMARAAKDPSDRPLKDIRMRVRLLN